MHYKTLLLSLPCLGAAPPTPFYSQMQAQPRTPTGEFPRAQELFLPARHLPTRSGPTALASADFDGNGYDDLVVAIAGDDLVPLQELVIFMFDAQGQTRTQLRLPLPPHGVVASDLDGDGDIDIASVNQEVTDAHFHATSLSILENDGSGHFYAARTIDLPATTRGLPLEIESGHLDTLANDLVVTHVGGIFMLTSGGSLNFTITDEFNLLDPRSLSIVDVDRNGADDLVLAIELGPITPYAGVVLFGDGAGGILSTDFSDSLFFPIEVGPWLSVVALDLEGDGDLDMVSSSGGGPGHEGLIRYNPNVGGVYPAYLALNRLPGVHDGQELVVGDFDHDGRPDLAGSSRASGHVEVFLMRGPGPLEPNLFRSVGKLSTGAGAAALTTGDWNADGMLDIACANLAAGSVSLLFGR